MLDFKRGLQMRQKRKFHNLKQNFLNKLQYRQKEESWSSEYYDPIEDERTEHQEE